jgi:hypothetical protein
VNKGKNAHPNGDKVQQPWRTFLRSQFCKEPLPDRSFTFWDWFHAVMKLTKEDLRSLWIDGFVSLFVSLFVLSFDVLTFGNLRVDKLTKFLKCLTFRALIGFISRQEAEEYLHKSENETFLVR